MPRLLYLYLFRRIGLGALVVLASLSVPVVLTSLFHMLPPAAVRGGLLWPAMQGTFPTVIYIALPMAVGVAAAQEFARMSTDGMIAVLYSIRMSVWSICLPAIAVAMMAVGAGYYVSCILAPAEVGKMHDVIHVIRNSLNHRMLDPGRFYTLDYGQRTLYFQRWRTADVATGMFIRQYSAEKHEEQVINAAEAEFRRNETGVLLIMSNGSIQSRADGSQTLRTANFTEYALPMTMQGNDGLPGRSWKGAFELPFSAFMADLPAARREPRRFAEWMSEATKRFVIPLLAIAHTLFGIGAVLTVSSATGRGMAANLTILSVPAVHVGILIAAETLVRINPALVGIVLLLIAAEIFVAIYLIQRQQGGFVWRREKPRSQANPPPSMRRVRIVRPRTG